VHDAKKTFKDASMEAFEKAMDLWSPDLISTKQNTEHYLIAFNFQYLKSGDTNPLVTAQELMSLKKYQKTTKIEITKNMISTPTYIDIISIEG
jgi:hypothetical protein